MAILTVNGLQLSVDQNQKLLPFLRDDLLLTSVKNGCSEGACGTCMVLIDGKATKACIQQTDKLDGKTIVTVEGLSPARKGCLCLRICVCGRGAVRLLHARHGHQRKGTDRPEPEPDTRGPSRKPSRTTSAAARVTKRLKTRCCLLPSSFARTPKCPQRTARHGGRQHPPHRGRRQDARHRAVRGRYPSARHAAWLRGAQQLSARKSALHRHQRRKSGRGRGRRVHGGGCAGREKRSATLCRITTY